MMPSDVAWLQVENTTKCNAWCPSCSRNQQGYGLRPELVIEDLSTDRFREVLELFSNIHTIQFCGTYGDSAAAANAMDHFELAVARAKKIMIHSHGGLRSTQWWQDLAGLLKGIDHDVWFALDGLKGVHELYRQGTDFDKAIENAQAFISAGGNATWQLIPFAHNEHQIKDCYQLSQTLGFKQFKVVRDARYPDSARHWRTGDLYEIKPWSMDYHFNSRRTIPIKNHVSEANCRHLKDPGVYLNANGTLSACCYFDLDRSQLEFNALPDIANELTINPHRTCLRMCGTPVILDQHATD
jgi:sulfatase maturation enzyme AslB (radical SAM superfamily)